VDATGVPIFGAAEPGKPHTERRAAYAVILRPDGTVAVVQGPASATRPSRRLWLPGGGTLPGESATETMIREIREELARDVRLLHPFVEAIEFFYAANDELHFRLSATFFRAELGEVRPTEPEYELFWIPAEEACREFYHQCHAWAVRHVMSEI
jgi:8-oxo-dGTP pyrophosphatase MutT (NUDIX family)